MTTYYAILRYRSTGNSRRVDFSSATERALCIIALADAVQVLEEGISES